VIKCESCPPSKHHAPSSLIQQPSGYYLCPGCHVSIKAKLSAAKKPIATPLENAVIIDRDELIGLKQDGLASLRLYVYMALRIDGVTASMQDVDVEAFCKKWAIQREDFITAIAALSKKGIVKINIFQLKAYAVTHKERVQAMEVAYESANSN
jgi:hypothetical protein